MLVLLCPAPVFAITPDEILKDSVLEARARALSAGMRCLVCQNQSIDDSDAPLARDLRNLIRERLTAGDSDDQITGFIVARYGEFVLLKPRLSNRTMLLWGLPFASLLLGALFLFWRRRKSAGDEQPLTSDEQAALERALRERQE
jgi:cytochrome c-type biogenesis protein CcmH